MSKVLFQFGGKLDDSIAVVVLQHAMTTEQRDNNSAGNMADLSKKYASNVRITFT